MRKYNGPPGCWIRKRDGRVICGRCQQERTPERHDPCLGTLPGVAFACCGHGRVDGYIYFENGITIRFPKLSVDVPAYAVLR